MTFVVYSDIRAKMKDTPSKHKSLLQVFITLLIKIRYPKKISSCTLLFILIIFLYSIISSLHKHTIYQYNSIYNKLQYNIYYLLFYKFYMTYIILYSLITSLYIHITHYYESTYIKLQYDIYLLLFIFYMTYIIYCSTNSITLLCYQLLTPCAARKYYLCNYLSSFLKIIQYYVLRDDQKSLSRIKKYSKLFETSFIKHIVALYKMTYSGSICYLVLYAYLSRIVITFIEINIILSKYD